MSHQNEIDYETDPPEHCVGCCALALSGDYCVAYKEFITDETIEKCKDA